VSPRRTITYVVSAFRRTFRSYGGNDASGFADVRIYGAKAAWFKDTEGHILAVIQRVG